MATSVSDLGTILGVWAHPDDETYLSAGVMAAAVDAGQAVTCVTATRGELGSYDEERWPSATMGAVRERELEESMRVLGVKDHRWLDYIDGSCSDVPFEEGVARIEAIMNEVRPDTVLTFGPDGMTGHDDHKSVGAWTTEAFARAAPAGSTLYYATQTQAWADRFCPILEPFNVFGPGTPPITPEDELAIDLQLEGEQLQRKVDAILKHESQIETLTAVFGDRVFFESQQREVFRLATRR